MDNEVTYVRDEDKTKKGLVFVLVLLKSLPETSPHSFEGFFFLQILDHMQF